MSKVLSLLMAFCVCSLAHTQPATLEQRGGQPENPSWGTMHLEAKLGSFKLLDGKGRVEVTFQGSLLVSNLKGSLKLEGELIKQYENRGKTCYFGRGKAIITGDFRSVFWFGKDMKATWYGAGVARLTGEYDKDMNPGQYWFEDPTKKNYWPATGSFDYAFPTEKKVTPKRIPG